MTRNPASPSARRCARSSTAWRWRCTARPGPSTARSAAPRAQRPGLLPIYLGPLLLLIFGWRILERLALIAQSQNTVSIADFIASRYGRSQPLAALVATIALIAAVPYLALQYKAVALSLQVLGGGRMPTGTFSDPALYVALLMALFAILFGTRQVDATEHRPGMMLAVALESVVKLIALVAVGLFAVSGSAPRLITSPPSSSLANDAAGGLVGQTLLATAIFCLPRQFHVAVVECGNVATSAAPLAVRRLPVVLIADGAADRHRRHPPVRPTARASRHLRAGCRWPSTAGRWPFVYVGGSPPPPAW